MIPKKIHYCWFGGNKLPKDLKKCIKSWKKKCPEYEIVKWDESNFDIRCSKFISDAYDAKAWAFVSDYARLKIIYENGGIYLDTDVELLKNLDQLLDNNCYFATQQADQKINTGLGFGAIKGHKFLYELLKDYENYEFNNDRREELACPILNTKVLEEHGYKYSEKISYINNIDVKVFPPEYFDPIAPGDSKNLLCNDTISIHHYSATWTNKKNIIKRKIIRLIGQNRINKIKKIIRRKK